MNIAWKFRTNLISCFASEQTENETHRQLDLLICVLTVHVYRWLLFLVDFVKLTHLTRVFYRPVTPDTKKEGHW